MHIQLNGQQHQTTEAATIAQLLQQLDLDPRLVAVEVNQQLIPRAQHADHQLRDNDEIEVVSFVGGG